MTRLASLRTSRVVQMTRVAPALLIALLAGCASYATPGRAADFNALGIAPEQLEAMTDWEVRLKHNVQPLAQFPTGLVVARVQAPGYRSHTARGWGEGAFSLVTTRDVESEEQFQRLARLPLVHGVAPMNRLLISSRLSSHRDLRAAAASLHADMTLIYTFDTIFDTEDLATPLTVVSLGLSPNQRARVTSTASAVLLDTRTGFVYAAAEATARRNQLASAWTSGQAIDQARRAAETEAFEKLIGEVETTWADVVQRHATATAATE